MKSIVLGLLLAVCYINSIDAQVTTCSQCRYGQCEQLQYSLTCHCVMGVKGTYCDRLLENGENYCLSNPCWNGGTCNSYGTSYTCSCPVGYSGADCRTVNAVTFATPATTAGGFITFPPVATTVGVVTFPPPPITPTPPRVTTQQVFYDKKIVVTNKGGYTSTLQVTYYNPTKTVQTGSITSGQSYAFYIPGNVDYTTGNGPVLEVFANGGNKVLSKKINGNPECIDVWGTTLFPYWSNVNC